MNTVLEDTMQKFGVILTLLVFIGALIIGYLHWNGKIQQTVVQQVNNQSVENNLSNEGSQSEKPFMISRDRLEQLVIYLPKKVANQFFSSYDNGQSVQMYFVGSPALASQSNGWSVQVKNQLQELYGSDFLEISIVEFDGTSTEFVDSEEAESVVQAKPDIVFFEALTLEDNGLVEIEVSHENIKNFIERIIAKNQDTAIILQPPHPIHAATYYPLQVEALANFAEDEDIPYFNHWPYWPDPNSDEINNFLNENGHPNENGHEVWANAVLQYFSGDKNLITN